MSEPGQKLGEALRSAREARGVDIAGVERDTKIRARYVEALERGEYRDLPGAVYTKGFLRNYGLYLGLDPEYLIDLYRLETRAVGPERPSLPSPPRPITRRRRAFIVEPGVVVAAILTVLVVALVGYLGFEFVTFARTPSLRVTDPPGDISRWTDDEYTLEGVTASNARVDIDGLRENPSVVADADGRFAVTVALMPGANVIEISAWDPEVLRESETLRRTITVVGPEPSPAVPPPELAIQAPADGSTTAGTVAIVGRAAPDGTVTVTAVPVEAPPVTFRVVDAASGAPIEVAPDGGVAPSAVSLATGSDGALAGEIRLPPGSWELTLVAAPGDSTVTRRVTVLSPDGLAVTLDIGEAESYVELQVDGTPHPRSGLVLPPGERVAFTAAREVSVLAGNAGSTTLTVNGVRLGTLGGPGAVVHWRIMRNS